MTSRHRSTRKTGVWKRGAERAKRRHVSEHAYYLFLYQPVGLAAVNKAVDYVPYPTFLLLAETSVTDRHWSMRKAGAKR